MAGHHVDLVGLHHLGDHGKPRGLARVLQQLEPFFLEALEGVGRGARLEGAAPENMGAARLHSLRHRHELRPRLDGARAGHDHDLLATDGHAIDFKLGRLGMRLAARQLEGLENPHHVLDAIEGLESEELLLGPILADHPTMVRTSPRER